jgi:DNA-binding YbaB/EbfC family protein
MTPEGASEGLDLGALISKLGEVQSSLHEAQDAAASQVVEGSAGGGAVRVRLTGGFEFQAVTIDPEVVDPADVEMLQDLVLAAIRDGLERANELQQQALSGTDPTAALGGLFGALGGPAAPGSGPGGPEPAG